MKENLENASPKEFFTRLQDEIDEIRNTLRNEESESLNRRRKIAVLSVLGMLDFGVISLYQTGVIRHLPDLPFKIFDSDYVNGSKKAYQMGLPDGTTGAMTYALLLMLLSYGGKRELARSKLLDTLLMGAVAANSLAGLQYLYDMAFKEKRVCLYCVTGAILNFLMVPLAAKELNKELKA